MANPTANINGREPDTDPTTIIATIGGTIALPTIGLPTTHLVFLRRTVKMSARVLASWLVQDEIPCPTVESDEEEVSGTRHPDKFAAHAVTSSGSACLAQSGHPQ
jgi:hypothetical protein